jgi:hypothetical protein
MTLENPYHKVTEEGKVEGGRWRDTALRRGRMAVPEASEAKSIKLSHLTYFQI